MERWFRRLLCHGPSPTADLYFVNACGARFGRAVERLAPTVFAAPRATLVMRHDAGLARPPRSPVVYLIDDDAEAGIRDPSLPAAYRRKLGLVECRAVRRYGSAAAAVVVSSEVLAERWRRLLGARAEVHLLTPYWDGAMPDLRHFAALDEGAAWIDVAYLGSRVHRADLKFLWPAIEVLLGRHPRLRFHLSPRHSVPRRLRGHPRIRFIPGRGWRAWRRALEGRRFHLALYPLLDTPFNRARSANKIIEHALVGAGGLYSASWPEARRAENEGGGLALPNRPEAWVQAVGHLVSRPNRMRALAAGGLACARRLNRAEPQRALWARLLGLEESLAP